MLDPASTNVTPANDDVVDEIAFTSDGIRIVGHLRRPSSPLGPAPAVLLTGPFTGVKEQVTGTYARGLTARGYITLALDHRNFGASEGTPRQHEDSVGKLHDLRDATSYLATHPDVDERRLGCVGVCLGASYALRQSAFDPRIRALALIAGAYNDPAVMRSNMGDENYRRLMADFAGVAQRQFVTGDAEYLAAVAEDQGQAAMPGDEPWRYYGTDRAASQGWVNQVTRVSIRELLTLDATSAVDFLAPTPLLVIHGRIDAYCSPDDAQRIYERASGTKDLVWLDTAEHIDLYDNPLFVSPAIDRTAAFLADHLV
ncbi:MAG: alpha/beta hydrolase [Acidimicrobiales bacterium]